MFPGAEFQVSGSPFPCPGHLWGLYLHDSAVLDVVGIRVGSCVANELAAEEAGHFGSLFRGRGGWSRGRS